MKITYNGTSVTADELRMRCDRKQEIVSCTSRAINGSTEAIIELSSIALSLNEAVKAVGYKAAEFAEEMARKKEIDGKAEVSLEELTGEKG